LLLTKLQLVTTRHLIIFIQILFPLFNSSILALLLDKIGLVCSVKCNEHYTDNCRQTFANFIIFIC